MSTLQLRVVSSFNNPNLPVSTIDQSCIVVRRWVFGKCWMVLIVVVKETLFTDGVGL